MGGELQPAIAETAAIDGLHDLADDYERRHGRRPTDVSHWDPADEVIQRLRLLVRVPPLREPIRYRFSYQLAGRPAVLQKLGYRDRSRRIFLTENGTSAILAVANALSLLGVTQVTLLAPRYFAAHYALVRMGIRVRRQFWRRASGKFEVPDLELAPGEVLWAETPIFGTGTDALTSAIPSLLSLMDEGHMVVVDEAMNASPSALGERLGRHDRYLAIHVPHKAVCVNGLKFGAVVFGARYYDAFDHWGDVLGGALSLSAEAAVDHFLSDAFDQYSEAVAHEAGCADSWLRETILEAGGGLVLDPGTVGFWRTVFAPFPASNGEDVSWLRDLMELTGTAIIPGARSRFCPDWGFCFRVNLLRDGPAQRAGLRRLLGALASSPDLGPRE